MVGAPGTSKGCHTCRKRKIRCDEGRPTCGQCQKSSRVCGGYAKPTVFFNQFAEEYTRPTAKNTSSEKIPEAPWRVIRPKGSKHWGNQYRVSDPAGPGKGNAIADLEHDVSHLSLKVPRPMGLMRSEQRLAYDVFVSYCLPVEGTEEIPLSFLSLVREIRKSHDALSLSCSAISFGWIGQNENNQAAIRSSRNFYGRALKRLQEVLAEQPDLQDDTTLATMEILSTYGMFELGSYPGLGWTLHLEAAEKMIQMRGPQAHIAGFSNSLFRFVRIISAVRALENRRSTFLASAEWKHIPFTLQPKNACHTLVDLAVEVPALLERIDSLRFYHEQARDRDAWRTLVAVVEMLRNMQPWSSSPKMKLPEGPSVLNPDMTQSRLSTQARRQTIHQSKAYHGYPSGSPFDLGASYDLLQTARLMHFFWTIQLLLLTSVFQSSALAPALARFQSQSQPDSVLGADPMTTTLPDFSDGEETGTAIVIDSTASRAFSQTLLSRDRASDLASKISTWSDFSAHNAWQCFGPILSSFNLRVAISWYEFDRAQVARAAAAVYPHERELEHCRALLDLVHAR